MRIVTFPHMPAIAKFDKFFENDAKSSLNSGLFKYKGTEIEVRTKK